VQHTGTNAGASMSDRPTAEDRFRTAQARLLVAMETRAVSRIVRARDAWAHVIEAGSGRPVVLVHGGAGGVAASLVPVICRLQAGFHLYAPDRPGCGLSDKPTYRGVRLREHAAGFLEGLLDSLGLDRVSLVGSSMGGWWALAFALAHPERVQRLALLGAPAGSARHPALRQRLLALPGLGGLLDALAPPDRARTRRRLASRNVVHPERLPEPLLDVVHAGARLPGARRAALGLHRAGVPVVGTSRLTYALRGELDELRLPVLVVWGERDPSPVQLGRELCDLMPDARLEVVPGAGHLVWLDEPEATAGLLSQFLGAGGRLSVRRGRRA
jgi:pimeloyl-ACP methyl ester carboxylesterase